MNKKVRAVRLWIMAVFALALLAPLPVRAQIPAISGDSEAFVEAVIDRPDPWQGQQITYTFRYYEAVDALRLPGILTGQPDYESPDFSNFWQEGEIEQTNYQQTVNGRTYNVSELHTILFPTTTGAITIPPARLILRDQPGAAERVLETLPVLLEVKPLPDSAPEAFSGAVGNFRLNAQVDRTITSVDEPIILRLTLSGPGNVRLAPLPALPVLDGWRILARGDDLHGDKIDGAIVGTRTLDYLLLPTAGGSITFPSIDYVFFDPTVGEYRGTLTDPISLAAEGAPAPATPAAAADALDSVPAQAAGGTSLQANEQAAGRPLPAIAPLAAPSFVPRQRAPLAKSAWYWALWAAPLAALAVGVGGFARSRQASVRMEQRRQARAGSEALHTLAARPERSSTPADGVARAQRVLTEYLARRLGRPIAGLTRSDLAALLQARGAPATVVGTVQECLTLGDLARFSPSAVDPSMGDEMQAKVEAAIRGLEKAI